MTDAQPVDAARVRVNGKVTAMLGVDPSRFRSYAARPAASSNRLWQSVADGDIAVSYTMGKLDRLPLGGQVSVAGTAEQRLRVGGFGTVAINGVDAVVSDAVARSLGFPAGNAIVVSAPHADIAALTKRIARRVPRNAMVYPLVSQQDSAGGGGLAGVTTQSINGFPTLSSAQLTTMLNAALSRAACRTCGAATGRPCSTAPAWCSGRSGRRA